VHSFHDPAGAAGSHPAAEAYAGPVGYADFRMVVWLGPGLVFSGNVEGGFEGRGDRWRGSHGLEGEDLGDLSSRSPQG